MQPQLYLNGIYVYAADAKISVFDRGFLFADAIYEVIPVTEKCLFLAEEHLDRLQKSLAAINMKMPISKSELMSVFKQLMQRNRVERQQNYAFYIQISRGVTA